MYATQSDYDAHLNVECRDHYFSDWSKSLDKKNEAWKIYDHARTNSLGMHVVGRLARSTQKNGKTLPGVSTTGNPSIDDSMRANLGTLTEIDGELGTILNSVDKWSLLGNDSWLLGGINACFEIHFASPLSWENLWAAEYNAMTVTGREVIGILSLGYEISRPTALEAIALPKDPARAKAANLIDYMKAVQSYTAEASLLKLWETIPANARRY
jgi:hypothetical protein